MNEVLFYVLGGTLAALAVITSLIGLRSQGFPASTGQMVGVLAVFAALVIGATTFAVRHAADEQEARAAETKGAEGEEAQGNVTSPSGAVESEAGGKEEATEPQAGAKGGNAAEGAKKPAKSAKKPAKSAKKPAEGAKKPAEGAKKPAKTAKKGGGAGGKQAGAGAQTAASTLQLAANPTQIAFDTKQLSTKAGKVTIDFTNPSAIEHDVAIEEGGKLIVVSKRIKEGKTSVSAKLAPGTYTFLCTVPGHAEAGMEGTLTVR